MTKQPNQRTIPALLRVLPDIDGSDVAAPASFPLRPLLAPAFLLPKEYLPLDDTVTEAAGLARRNDLADPYAGSY